MIALAVTMVAVGIFASTVVTSMRHRVVGRESRLAAEAVQNVLEEIRNEEFREIFALYNAAEDDDPGGVGSAPGHRFAVEGLAPIEGSVDGLIGEIQFPAVDASTLEGGGAGWVMREDFVDDDLGMPRDLNGDSLVDDADHAGDYIVLPLRIRLDWDGVSGHREFEMCVMLSEFRRDK